MFIGNLNSIGNLPIGGAGTSYLLDTYSAAAAYSLRQLKTGVTNVVRVRRSSDSAESDFTATELTDGTLTTWTGANDGLVVTWYDQTGNSADITMATAASQPQLVTAGVVNTKGSLPCVTFDGTDDRLYYGSSVIGTGDFSTFTVTSMNLNNANRIIAFFSTQSTNPQTVFLNHERRTNNVGMYIRNTLTAFYITYNSVTRNNSNQLLQSSFNNSNALTHYDNGNTGTGTTLSGSFRSTNVNIGSSYGSGSYVNYFDGDMQEIIIFNTEQTANRTDIESDINTHYSIY
jgi:hypothetical protein